MSCLYYVDLYSGNASLRSYPRLGTDFLSFTNPVAAIGSVSSCAVICVHNPVYVKDANQDNQPKSNSNVQIVSQSS